MKRLFISLSIPVDFKDKFINFLTNVNKQNDDIITIEDAFEQEIVAVPIETMEKLK